jgi:hypothetical protein
MKNFNPRHLRKKFNNKSGGKDIEKSRTFRRAAAWSKQFIHQSASTLESPAFATRYQKYCEACRRGTLSKGG